MTPTPIDVQLVVYQAATDVPRWQWPAWNRLRRIIGASFVAAGWCVSLRWRRP